MILGHTYSRSEISGFVGGSTQGMFPIKDGKVTCACLKPDLNRALPFEIWLGEGVEERETVAMLVRSGQSFPLFVHEDSNCWRFWGRYRVLEMLDSPEVAEAASKAGNRPISSVLVLTPDGDSWDHDRSAARKLRVAPDRIVSAVARRYWVTVHWPRRVDQLPKPQDLHVYIPDGRQKAGREMSPGDLVIIFETKGGKTRLKVDIKGNEIREACVPGRQGAVAIVEVTKPLTCDPSVPISKYTDGSSACWSWIAQTKLIADHGFIPRESFNPLVDKEPNYAWLLASSVLPITKAQFEAVRARFEEQPPPPGKIEELVEKYRRGGGRGGGGGEGEPHRLLKEYVFANPAAALGEVGMSPHRMEYSFPTGDRADVVLKDSFGCFVAVEVEVAQGADQVEGLLQAIKYRHMLAFLEGRSFAETRSYLVAYDLAPELCELCGRYGVTPIRVPAVAVERWRATRDAKVPKSVPTSSKS